MQNEVKAQSCLKRLSRGENNGPKPRGGSPKICSESASKSFDLDEDTDVTRRREAEFGHQTVQAASIFLQLRAS